MGDLALAQNLESEQTENSIAVAVQSNSGELDVDLNLLSRHLNGFAMPDFSADAFFRVGFTHHSEILAKEKSLDGRLLESSFAKRQAEALSSSRYAITQNP